MQKVRVVGLQGQKGKVVEELHRMGVIDLRKSALKIEDDLPGEALPEVSELLVKFNSAKVIMENCLKGMKKEKVKFTQEKQLKTEELIEAAKSFKAVGNIASLEERRMAIENELAKVAAARATASYFVGSGIDFSKLRSGVLDFSAYLLPGKSSKAIFSAKELAEQKGSFEMIENRTKEGTALFVACRKGDTASLSKLEHARGVRKIDISNEYLDSTAEKVMARLDKMKAAGENERKETARFLQKHVREDYPMIVSMLEMLNVEADRSRSSIGFKKTAATFVVEGWIQRSRFESLDAGLKAATGDKAVLEKIEADDLAPTLFKESWLLGPFYKMIEFFSLPRSDELDPSIIFAITFPLFYGLMVCDVGYGVVSFLFATLITMLIKDPDDLLYNVAKIWQISSVAVIFFGFLSNQYFGFQLNQYFTTFNGFDWLKDSTTILAATVFFGIAQVILGLVFSFVNNYHHGHKKHAISKITSIIVVISGTLAVAGFLFNAVSGSVTMVSTIVLLISLVITMALSGSEAVEVVSLMSHPLSYARIMGFGLASVILALLIDKGFTPSLSQGVMFIPILLMFIFLHFFNMILGIFEGLVQGVRLNFVEFFSKFYTGGGIKFRPFTYKRRYTKEV